MLTTRMHVILLFLVLATVASGFCWWTAGPRCPTERGVRLDLCGCWTSPPLAGTHRRLELFSDGTFEHLHTFAGGPVGQHLKYSGTWTADSELVVLLIGADRSGPIKPENQWRVYLPITPGGRLRDVWLPPSDPQRDMYMAIPSASMSDNPR